MSNLLSNRAIFTLILALACATLFGCGMKERVVVVSVTKHPEEGKGLLYVATNKPMDVAIQGSDLVYKRDMGGYYLIHPSDMEAMINAIRD